MINKKESSDDVSYPWQTTLYFTLCLHPFKMAEELSLSAAEFASRFNYSESPDSRLQQFCF